MAGTAGNAGELMTMETAAKRLGVSKSTISRWSRLLKLGREYGNVRLLAESDLTILGKSIRGKRGNPDGWTVANQKKRAERAVKAEKNKAGRSRKPLF